MDSSMNFQVPGANANEGEIDVTMQAFSNWLTEVKARSDNSLQQMLAEMGIIRDGITSNNTDLTEFKRHSTSIQQQMQSQLTDLREKLTSAFGELTSLVKHKTATDQELLSEIQSLQEQLSLKTAELDALKKSYSQTHQQLQNHLLQIQTQVQGTYGDIQAVKRHAQGIYDGSQTKFQSIEENLRRLEEILDEANRDNLQRGNTVQVGVTKVYEGLTSLSAEFFEHKKASSVSHTQLQSQTWMMEEAKHQDAQNNGVVA
eukprot:GEMP01044494.1.p1 GENE.GEMP01044494.1~~GEMP01044494.1.p1  ORF type:complete len:259 (+),score=60.77 GEMP01044494.1:170-946(+)